MPCVNTEAMQHFLAGLAATIRDNEHVAMVLDQAGWHGAKAYAVPSNITLVPPPPESPELDPVERVWLHLKERFLSCRKPECSTLRRAHVLETGARRVGVAAARKQKLITAHHRTTEIVLPVDRYSTASTATTKPSPTPPHRRETGFPQKQAASRHAAHSWIPGGK